MLIARRRYGLARWIKQEQARLRPQYVSVTGGLTERLFPIKVFVVT